VSVLLLRMLVPFAANLKIVPPAFVQSTSRSQSLLAPGQEPAAALHLPPAAGRGVPAALGDRRGHHHARTEPRRAGRQGAGTEGGEAQKRLQRLPERVQAGALFWRAVHRSVAVFAQGAPSPLAPRASPACLCVHVLILRRC
jgi:hypothetical protein